jgi:hypothetical protein
VEAAASASLDAMFMPFKPPPLAMHHPKMANAAMGMVKPFTVKT